MNIAFIGLGVMGYPMAGHQQRAGHQVCVYNRTSSKAEQWVNEYGGSMAATPVEASAHADVVMLCVGNDNDVRSVVYGDTGVLTGIQSGAVLVDHTTTSHTLAIEINAACEQQGLGFLDAPVSGGQAGAENGALAVMVGGTEAHLNRVSDALAPYSKTITRMGAVGAGQMTKMVNQILISGILQGISEGFTLARKAELDLPTVIDAISQGAAGSWQLSNRGPNIDKGKFDYGFAIDWMVKDLGFCLDAAASLGLRLPNTEFVRERYQELQAKGCQREDTSALIKQFE